MTRNRSAAAAAAAAAATAPADAPADAPDFLSIVESMGKLLSEGKTLTAAATIKIPAALQTAVNAGLFPPVPDHKVRFIGEGAGRQPIAPCFIFAPDPDLIGRAFASSKGRGSYGRLLQSVVKTAETHPKNDKVLTLSPIAIMQTFAVAIATLKTCTENDKNRPSAFQSFELYGKFLAGLACRAVLIRFDGETVTVLFAHNCRDFIGF